MSVNIDQDHLVSANLEGDLWSDEIDLEYLLHVYLVILNYIINISLILRFNYN